MYEDLYAKPTSFLKKFGNVYITEEQNNILKKHNIYAEKYKNIDELLFKIEELLNNSIESLDDLEWVSESLSEYNYYNNTNK